MKVKVNMDEEKPTKCKLTRREKQIAELILRGYKVKEISKKLNISIKAVSFHTANLRIKMDASKTIRAAVLAQELGLLEQDK